MPIVEDAEKILLDGVFAQAEFACDFAIAQAIGNQGNYLLLAGGEQPDAARVDHVQ